MKNKLYIEHMPTGCDTCPHNYKSPRNYSKCNLTRHYTTGSTTRLGSCPLQAVEKLIVEHNKKLVNYLEDERSKWCDQGDNEGEAYMSEHGKGVGTGLTMAVIHVKNFGKGEVE